jgi:hypothetical protein
MKTDRPSSIETGNTASGLKVATNLKAGAAACNPTLLNTNMVVVGGLNVRTNMAGGASPCTHMVFSD